MEVNVSSIDCANSLESVSVHLSSVMVVLMITGLLRYSNCVSLSYLGLDK